MVPKGEGKFNYNGNIGCDVIFSERRGQSQKPNEIYDLVEQLVPNGKFFCG
jgi:mRNA (2'-O-methyladenosine-N6-)-methyltransferase